MVQLQHLLLLFCIDILGINRNQKSEVENSKTRKIVHLTFTLIFLILVIIFKVINDKSIIGLILKIAGYTYIHFWLIRIWNSD